MTEEGFAKALVDYHRAIALDPDYALAYAGIADYYIFLGIYGIMPFAESSAAAKEAAQRAVALDDMLAEAYAALGFATVCRDFDWRTAEEHHRRALELNPNSPTAHNWYSFNLLQQARFDEARAEVDRVLALDPMSPLGITSLAWCHYHARRFDEALAAYCKLIEAEPRFGYGRLVYSWALRCAGRYEEAVTQAAKAVELAGDGQLYLTGLGAAYAAAGRNDDARSMLTLLRELARTRYVSPYCLALIYCYLGDKEQALALLEEAVAIDDAWVTWLVVDPQLDTLRADPRFLTLAERTNNPAAALAATGLATGDKSIAILPLKVLTPARADDTSDEYLGLGLADALITRLSRVQQLIVRPANSVLRYQGGDADPIQAGRELQVNYVVSGNIRRV
ncbi:MAG TPA: tetratricopeptide repeat protein, partial [Pyrinomonadaceae bacterium]|nr:tetratricopeptide repeat protein [Pyrinomonadaceae bacterium]